MSPEEKAEKRERLKKIRATIKALSPEQRQQLVDSCGTILTIDGRALSVHNACMLIHQADLIGNNVTVVGGFRQWKKAGRYVRKGEHSLCIWAPTGNHNKERDPDDIPELDDNENEKPDFILVNVFDISQTDEQEKPQTADAEYTELRLAA